MGLRTLLLGFLMSITVPLIFASPYLGVIVYYWLTFMAPHTISYTSIPWVFIIGALVGAAWLLSKEPKKIPVDGVTFLVILFFCWCSITTLFALFPDVARKEWVDATKVFYMFLLTLALISTKDRLTALVWVAVISWGYWSVKGGLWVIMTAGAHDVLGPAGRHHSNNDFSRAIIMTLPLFYFLYFHSAQRFVRIGLGAATLLSIVALIGTNSRGGFVGFAAMMLAYAWYSRRRVKLLAFGAIAIVLGLVVLPQTRVNFWTDRMESIEDYEDDGSVQGRFDSWAFAIDLAAARPITGGGYEAFLATRRSAHSNYFQVLGEQGYVGLLIYLLMGYATFAANNWTIRNTRKRPELYWARDLAFMTNIALIGYWAGGLTINHAYIELHFFLISIAVITRRLVKEQIAPARKRYGAGLSDGAAVDERARVPTAVGSA